MHCRFCFFILHFTLFMCCISVHLDKGHWNDRWKMQTEDGSQFDETVHWDCLFARSLTNSMKLFVLRRAEFETLTGYFHDFSTSGWAMRAAVVILRIWKFKNKRSPIVGSDCKWLHCQFHRIVRWPPPDLARHCSAAAPRRASACLRSSRVSLTLVRVNPVQLSWPHTTHTHTHTLCYTAVLLPACLRAHCSKVWCKKMCTLVSNAGSFVRLDLWLRTALALMCHKHRLNKSGADSEAESPANRPSSGNSSRL